MRVDILNKEQSEQILRYLDLPHSLIWEIGISTGLRISDILTLKANDIIKQYAYIREKKTGKKRRIYVRKSIRLKAMHFIEINHIKPYEKVFLISRQAVWKAFKRASRKAGIATNVGTHSMRKTYSSAYLTKGYTVADLQNRLNHSMVGDTIGYITSNATLGLDEHGERKKRSKRNAVCRNKS